MSLESITARHPELAAPCGAGRRSRPLGTLLCGLLLVVAAVGCKAGGGPPYDYPFPLGQVSDSIWETQQTNAEAADFIFFDHEFEGSTANLAPAAKRKLEAVALRLEHVPFPITIEQSPNNARPQLDAQRRQAVIEQLARVGVPNVDKRVVIAKALTDGFTAIEGEQAYYQNIYNNFGSGGGAGRRFGGMGGMFR